MRKLAFWLLLATLFFGVGIAVSAFYDHIKLILAPNISQLATTPHNDWYDDCIDGRWGNHNGTTCIYYDGDGHPQLYPGWFDQ